jgi:hypothetical protein
MESNLKVNRIHCSSDAAEALKTQCPELPLKSRGMIPIKGKGAMHTFWVNEQGRGCSNRVPPLPVESKPLEKALPVVNKMETLTEEGRSSEFLSTEISKPLLAAMQPGDVEAPFDENV